jgi:hypothetical protein
MFGDPNCHSSPVQPKPNFIVEPLPFFLFLVLFLFMMKANVGDLVMYQNRKEVPLWVVKCIVH